MLCSSPFPNLNVQLWPTIEQFISTLEAVILGYGISALTNAQVQTVAFGQTFAVAPGLVLVTCYPQSSTATVLGATVVQGSITTTGFQVVLTGYPGDALHKIGWLALQ